MVMATCAVCGHSWRARTANPPRCKGCGSRRWAVGPKVAVAAKATGGARVVVGPGRMRAVIDDSEGDRECARCGHTWSGPRYRRCPACNRFEWWQPFRESRAARRDRERNEAHEAARLRAETAQVPVSAPRPSPLDYHEEAMPNGDIVSSWVNLDTGEQGSTTHAWADLFNGALAEAEPMEAQMLRDWLALVRAREAQAVRDQEAQAASDRLLAEWLAEQDRIAASEAATEAEAARRAALRAEAARPDQEWLRARWYRPVARALRSLAPGAGCAAVALLAAGLLWSLDVRAWPAHVQAWMDAPDAPEATHGAPAMFREEDYLVAHREAQEMVADWDAKIEARIEHDRALPGDIDLAGARAQRAFWADRAATMSEHLEQYR